jgi:hypothetical protein
MSEQTWIRYKHAQCGDAWRLVTAMAASAQLTELLSDGERKVTPRQLASLACDIANAMKDELLRREWAEPCDKTDPP